VKPLALEGVNADSQLPTCSVSNCRVVLKITHAVAEAFAKARQTMGITIEALSEDVLKEIVETCPVPFISVFREMDTVALESRRAVHHCMYLFFIIIHIFDVIYLVFSLICHFNILSSSLLNR